MIAPIKGRWWLDEGRVSGVWPCEVLDASVFGIRVRPTLGPNRGETFVVGHERVHDSGFNRVRDAERLARV